jgi:hypothetical protein
MTFDVEASVHFGFRVNAESPKEAERLLTEMLSDIEDDGYSTDNMALIDFFQEQRTMTSFCSPFYPSAW